MQCNVDKKVGSKKNEKWQRLMSKYVRSTMRASKLALEKHYTLYQSESKKKVRFVWVRGQQGALMEHFLEESAPLRLW